LVMHRENKSGRGALLSNSWLLGLRATMTWSILISTRSNKLIELV
ncbi:MAG: hypothetical protein ACI8SZ_002407, partial [Colwellia sp.]